MLADFFGIDGTEVISLSHRFAVGAVRRYPGDPDCRSEPVATLGNEGHALNYVSVGEHTGTHRGAPCHFNKGEAAAHELDPEDFFLPGALIDVRSHAARDDRDDDDAVSARDLEAWESAHGPFPAECAVIVNTGWPARGPAERDDDLDPDGTQRNPGFAPDAARRLLDRSALGRRGALSADASSPDVTFSVSEILSREHRLSLEVLANLDRLPRRRPRPPAETVSARVAARNQRGLAKRLSPLPGRPRAAADAALGIECRRAGAGVLRWKGRIALRKDLPSEPARARFGARRTLRSRHGRLFSR